MYSLVIMSGLVALSMAMPRCTVGKYEIIAKPDCKGYYLCVNGGPVEMPDCPPGSVFSRMAHVCVPADSYYDDCTPSQVPDTKPTVTDLGRSLRLIFRTVKLVLSIPNLQEYFDASEAFLILKNFNRKRKNC